MTNKTNEAIERYKLEIVNNHGDRYIRCEPAPDGSWIMFKDVAMLQARIAELEAAIQQARRDGREEAARTVEIMWLMFREKDAGASDWIFCAHDDIPTGDDFATAIRQDPAVLRARAALEGWKKDG